MQKFRLKSEFKPAGDQPKAIESLVSGLKKGMRHQTLLGVTGSGKTFTVANVIEKIQKPTLVIAHNKTLAAQLAQEYRDFFPNNAVHYFVSYYDYYQPEAYMPITDTYIEKEAMINEEIDRLRHASTQALLTRQDVIIVASVSCIYGLGSPEEYEKVNMKIEKGMKISRNEFIRSLVAIFYERTNADLSPGMFRAIGNAIEIMPVDERVICRIEISGENIENVKKIDAVSRSFIRDIDIFYLFPAKHFITSEDQKKKAIKSIKTEAGERVKELEAEGKNLEAERLKRRTNYDLALIREVGYCNGIENYSRHFSGRAQGEAPDTLISYFPRATPHGNANAQGSADFLTIIDESHVTVPQIGGMYAGDASRKKTLIEHGFRLPSAADNRPLKFNEFEERIGQVIYTSATPAEYEFKVSGQVVEQVIRPTGLIDPMVEVRPITGSGDKNPHTLTAKYNILRQKKDKQSQVNNIKYSTQGEGVNYKGQIVDFIAETEKAVKRGNRVIATTLTKKMAEDLSEFLKEKGVKAEYLHSDIKTIDRIELLTEFRKGKFDCIVGVNLLREGLDLPEVSFIGILDADKEGFLRSETSLIQTIGRAARNVEGRVILYADNITGSMEKAIGETERRREIQLEYNKKHNITPKTIIKKIHSITDEMESRHQKTVKTLLEIDKKLYEKNPTKLIKEKTKQMNDAVKILDFETAAIIRDEIVAITKELESKK